MQTHASGSNIPKLIVPLTILWTWPLSFQPQKQIRRVAVSRCTYVSMLVALAWFGFKFSCRYTHTCNQIHIMSPTSLLVDWLGFNGTSAQTGYIMP